MCMSFMTLSHPDELLTELDLLADGSLHVGEQLDVDGLGQSVALVALQLL